MALILKKSVDLYFYLNDEVSDPRVRSFLFMSNPFPMITIVILYLFFVLKWGPKYMENRKPYNLDGVMVVYNIIQIIACIHLVVKGLIYAYPRQYNILCEPVDYTVNDDSMEVVGGVHLYFILKIIDLLDTVFFVMRKKNNQISFLHVYHHAGMVVLCWNATKFLGGGQSVFTGFINSIIHIVMYTYYLVTAFSTKHKNNVWWKKYITQMQIIQFLFITLHWASLLVNDSCGYPRWPVAIMIPQNFFMLALFGDFYRKAYLNKKPKVTVNGVSSNGSEMLNNKFDINRNCQNNNDDIKTEKYLNGATTTTTTTAVINNNNNIIHKREKRSNGVVR